MSNKHRLRSGPAIAVGLPGQPPGPEARTLARSPSMGTLPPGVWHVSDWAASLLAGTTPVVVAAVHEATGGGFRLLLGHDGLVLGFSPGDDALVARWYGDPTAWARAQRWAAQAPTEGG